MFNDGVIDTMILTTLLILLVANEVLSGINLEEIVRLRRMVRVGTVPLAAVFLLLAALRIAHLV